MRLGRPALAIAASFATLCGVVCFVSLDDGLLEGPQTTAEYSAIASPRMQVSLRRDQLQLEGHTISVDHERRLVRTIDALFPGTRASAVFRPLGTAPDDWADASVQLLNALSVTQSSTALLTNDQLQLRGVATAEWHKTMRALQTVLPDSLDVEVDVIIPDSSVRARDVCSRALKSQQIAAVSFEESSTVLRSSAKRVLDRVISLADACRDSVVSITGHTDSSGSEASNLALSLARAHAVADYLAERGIARERLRAAGAGSSQPVADNRTRYGRGLNRRIEILLSQKP